MGAGDSSSESDTDNDGETCLVREVELLPGEEWTEWDLLFLLFERGSWTGVDWDDVGGGPLTGVEWVEEGILLGLRWGRFNGLAEKARAFDCLVEEVGGG